eukprot:gene24436-29305_t
MPPKRRTGGPSSPQNRRPKIAGSARSLNPEVAKPTLTKAESGDIEPPKTETYAPESTPGPDLTKPAKTVADEPKAPATPETGAGESATTPTQSKPGWRLVAILGAAAVIVAILAGIAFFKVGAKTDDIAWVDEGATAEVLRVTPSAVAAVFTFSPDTFDADFDKGVQGLNQSMRDQLTQYKDTQKAGVEQTQTATTADVPLIGITRLEKDRAQLLAQLNVSSTQNGVAADSRSGMVIHLRTSAKIWIDARCRSRFFVCDAVAGYTPGGSVRMRVTNVRMLRHALSPLTERSARSTLIGEHARTSDRQSHVRCTFGRCAGCLLSTPRLNRCEVKYFLLSATGFVRVVTSEIRSRYSGGRNSTERPAQTKAVSGIPGAPKRVSFAKVREPLEVPGLLDVQTDSFEWLIGAQSWRERAAALGDNAVSGGLEDILAELSPIEDFNGTMSLSFSDPRFDEVKASTDECKDKDMTYAAPLFVTAEFINNNTGEIKSQTVFMGDFPMMTDKGTFIINGTERVVVSQLVRSPGVYFDMSVDKSTEKDLHSVKVIPGRGAWLEFDVDKRDTVGVRIDRKRRQPVTVLLKALGWTTEQITERFGFSEILMATLEKDNTAGTDEALLDIYRKLRPGEPPTKESAQTLLENLFFKDKRYDLARVGRYKINKKLGLNAGQPIVASTLTEEDIVATVEYLVRLHAGDTSMTAPGGVEVPVEVDDIDHFGNRRLRTVGELIQNQIRVGLSRMERVVRERMTTQDVEAITPQTLINIRPVVAAIREFFGTSQLSQFMDQNNPLSGLTHKRRLSALGPGGLSRERAGLEVRDVHPSHYGRMCPIETPEGPNIGLIGSLSVYARVNPF